MKTFTLILLLLIPMIVFGQSISETLFQVDSLKVVLENRLKIVEKSLEDMRASDPLFADRDQFETESEYGARILKGYAKMAEVKNQSLEPVKSKLSELRYRIWETYDFTVELGTYNADTQLYPMTIQHNGYQKETLTTTLLVTREVAKTFYQNWDSIVKKGILCIDLEDKVSLIKVIFEDPITGSVMFRDIEQSVKYVDSHTKDSNLFDSVFIIAGDKKKVVLVKQTLHKYGDTHVTSFYALNDSLPYYEFVEKINPPDINSIIYCRASPDLKYIAYKKGHKDTYYDYYKHKTAYMFDQDNGNIVSWLSQQGWYGGPTFSPDSRSLISFKGENLIIWDIETNRVINTSLGKSILALSPDLRKVACVGPEPENKTKNTRFILLMDTDENHKEERIEVLYPWDGNVSIKFSPDSRLLAVILHKKKTETIYFFNVDTRKQIAEINYEGSTQGYTFSEDNKYFLAGGDTNNECSVFDVQKGEIIIKLKGNIKDPWMGVDPRLIVRTRSLAFGPNTSYLIRNNEIWYTNYPDQKPITQVKANKGFTIVYNLESPIPQQSPIDTQEVVHVYDSSSIQAAKKMLETEPQAFGKVAGLFEEGGDHRQAALYYAKAKDTRKAITNAEMITPKPYDILIDMYTEVGNKAKANQYLDSLYVQNPEISVAYFKKCGLTMELRNKAVNDKQYGIAIHTYEEYQSLSEVEKDELMDLYQKVGDKTSLNNLVNQRIPELLGKKSLYLVDFDTLIGYYSILGNTAKVTEYQNKAKTRKVDIAKAEKFWIGKSYSFSSKQVYGDMFWNYQIMPDHKASEKTEDYYYYDGVKGPSSYRTNELTWEVDQFDLNVLKLSNGKKLVNKDGKVSLLQ